MRSSDASRRPPLARSPVMPGVAALLATIAVGTAGCSGQPGAAVAPSLSATGRVEPLPTSVTRFTSVPRLTFVPRSTSQPAAKGAHLARSVPVRLKIAAIGVNSELMDLGLKDDGTMEVPPRGFPAGWYTGAPTPGELGPAIIVGHIDWKGPGVFYNLRNLLPGDEITVTRKDGSKPVFRVTRVAKFPKDQFPTKLVYGNSRHAVLRLITCGGYFDKQSGHYEDNIVAFADLVTPPR